MSLLKRITATFTASVDNVVARVENHDAIVLASLQECRRAAAKTRVRLSRVQRDGEQMRKQQEKNTCDINLWKNRAKDCARTDEQKALQCVKRMQLAEKNLGDLEKSITVHHETERRIRGNLSDIESRIVEINQQRNTMRTRQSAAEATRVIHCIEADNHSGIEETFDRWESSLVESEITTAPFVHSDPLETEFIAQEEMELLRAELDQLVNPAEDKTND